MAAPASAQRTGDHIVPAIETVCDDDPFSFGLCNAYCEALDCHCPTPGTPECTALGTPRACSNLLKNYRKKSGGAAPPCGCPCAFNVQGDLNSLRAAGLTEFGHEVDGPFVDFCDTPAFNNMEPTYIGEQFTIPGEGVSPDGLRLLYWVDNEADTCRELGGLLDDVTTALGDFDYQEGFFDRTQPLDDPGEAGACAALLDFLCDDQ